MARGLLQDKLQNYKFWLMDVAPIESLALPILTPALGFSSITAPEISVETYDVQEGNFQYPRKVIQSANIGTITLSRASTFYDSDFWRWIMTALAGDPENFNSGNYGLSSTIASGAGLSLDDPIGLGLAFAGGVGGIFGFPRVGGPSPRRDLLLIQYFPHLGGEEAAIMNAFASSVIGFVGQSPLTAAVSGTSARFGKGFYGSGPTGADRVPAKAWMLRGCIPTRYKVSGDFDATDNEVSIQELDFEVSDIEEVSLSA